MLQVFYAEGICNATNLFALQSTLSQVLSGNRHKSPYGAQPLSCNPKISSPPASCSQDLCQPCLQDTNKPDCVTQVKARQSIS